MAAVNIKSLLAHLNNFCRTGLESAAGACVARSHYEITVEHVIWQMIESPVSDFSLILKHYGIAHEDLKAALSRVLEEFPTGNTAKPVFSPRLIDWYQQAQLEATVELGEPQIRSGALFAAFISKADRLSSPEVTEFFSTINLEDLRAGFKDIIKNSIEETASKEAPETPGSPGEKTALEKYCEDFTQKAENGDIDPVFGRDSEIRQVIDIFARRRKNNPIVVGEAGVGKTAVVEGLALRIVQGDVPDFLKDVSIMGLDMGLLQAGAGVRGEFENRLKKVIEEVKASEKPIIMFIDEAHTMIGAGGPAGGSDAANLLKPALARGELRTVAATTWSEYKKYFEKDAALARRFQPVYLAEPSEDTATLILRGLKDKYEQSHGVVVRDDAVLAASRLSARYISGRYLPDKAIDLLDTSCARVKVLLTAKPDAVENLERRIQALEREEEALLRDGIYGVDSGNQRLDEIKEELGRLKTRFDEISQRWKAEQELCSTLIDLRKSFYQAVLNEKNAEQNTADSTQNPDIDPGFLKQQITDTEQQLKQVHEQEKLVKTEVDPGVVSQVVSDWTGIPVGKVLHDDAKNIQDMEHQLGGRVRGQDTALAEISRIIRASKAGLKDPGQPLGVFLLAGPSGVGKTETGLAVAELLFGGEKSAVSVNMSEFQEKHTVSRLIGSPPGYVGYGEGGVLTEAVRRRPYSAVLLDEAEKANQEVINLFYQVFDKGELSDGEGRNIDFKNTVIFLTSNLGADIISQMAASEENLSCEQIVSSIRPVLSAHFKPALLARMRIIPYMPLGADVMEEIVEIKLQRLQRRVKQAHNIVLECTSSVISQIAQRCLEVETGARNIDHIMEGTILPLVSQEILSGFTSGGLPGQITLATAEDGSFVLHVNQDNKETASM